MIAGWRSTPVEIGWHWVDDGELEPWLVYVASMTEVWCAFAKGKDTLQSFVKSARVKRWLGPVPIPSKGETL